MEGCNHEEDVLTGGCIVDGNDGWFKVEPPCVPKEEKKCGHGVYIAKGDTVALYCTACNPGAGRIFKSTARVMDVAPPEKVVEVDDYLRAPVWERLAFAAQMGDMV
jgi:hypothetical protein